MSESLLCGIPFDDMQNLSEIFKDVNVRSSLVQFTDVHIARLESSLFERTEKPCSNVWRPARKNSPSRKKSSASSGFSNSLKPTATRSAAFISNTRSPLAAIPQARRHCGHGCRPRRHPYIIVEVKATKLKDGKEQLRSYTHAKDAPLALWSNGALAVIWHRKNPNYFVEIPDLPKVTQTIDDIAGQPGPSMS